MGSMTAQAARDMPDTDLRAAFLGGMSNAACTVNVVTTDGPAGRAGVTVSAMSSVSADTPKPTLLVCVHHLSAAADAVLKNGVFCVNVLRDDQSYISDTFAGRFSGQIDDKFDCADWTTQVTGAPRVIDPLVAFDCRLVSSNLIGTHYVFFGEVEEIFASDRGSPLIYANRAYGETSRIDAPQSLRAGHEAAGRKLSVGCFHTFGPYVLPELISRLKARDGAVDIILREGDQRRIQESLLSGETEIGLLYDMDLSDRLDRKILTTLQPYVLLADGHPLSGQPELTAHDLAGYPMVLLDASPSRDYFQSILSDAGIEIRPAYRSASFETVRGMVGHGLGFALLVTKPASAMTYDGRALVTRPLRGVIEPSRMVLAWRRGASLSPQAEAFARHCHEFFTTETR